MNITTKLNLNGKLITISESQTNYGAGGAFPSMANEIEAKAECDLAVHLFPDAEDGNDALGRAKFSAACPKAREIEAREEIVDDGSYPTTVTVDGAKHEMIVSISW